MSVTFDNSKRQALPRCVDYSTACALGLLRATRYESGWIKHIGHRTREEWLKHRNLFTAIDLVGEAVVVKDFESVEAVEAAEYILNRAQKSRKLAKEMANTFLATRSLTETENNPMISEVNYSTTADLKKHVRFYPSNPIAWSDLSLCYATMGQVAKATSAMQVALSLGKSNRFILRSAARCFMHLGEPDRAIDILNRSGLCSFDPWIASAEISISESAGLTSKCISRVKYLLPDNNLTEFSRSELAVNMGTVEMKHGVVRSAKKLMRQALRDPTENALAQAQWMANQLGTGAPIMADLEKLEVAVPGSYEAQALRLYYNLKFEESLTATAMWGRFQQLSGRPIIHASHIAAAFLDDDKRAIDILANARPAQTNGFLYLNNYAFSLARSGDIEAAVKKLESIGHKNLSNREKNILVATTGLICFRSGDVENGRNLYDIAIKEFDRMDEKESAAVAAYYFAREEKHILSANAEKRVREAKRRLERFDVPLLNQLAKKLTDASS